jgi:DNA primase catalytic core
MSFDNRQIIDELARRANLPSIAEKCGLNVVYDGSRKPRACCPFHDDHRPSLQFYSKDGSSDREQFHCFVCGAHGDVFALVKELRKLDFWESVNWVATEYGITIQQTKQKGTRAKSPQRLTCFQEAARIYGQLNHGERELLAEFAKKRGFQSQVLVDAEVFAAQGNKIVANVAGDRVLLESMQEAGIIRQTEPMRESGLTMRLPLPRPLRDFYSTDRIVFTIRSRDGDIVGFSGRAIGNEPPKYLFTKNLPKGETLYRLDHVIKVLRAQKLSKNRKNAKAEPVATPVFHLFVVEGLLDALRLEGLGFKAVAVLGNQLSTGQTKLIAQLAEEADRWGLQLAVHLFFDADAAGRNGMASALPSLLRVGAEGVSFGVDVIVPLNDDLSSKHDPDELFRDIPTFENAMTTLAPWCYPALDFLLAEGLESQVSRLADDWPRTEVSLRMRAMRFVERQLDASYWPRVLDRIAPFESWLQPNVESPFSDWQNRLSHFLRAMPAGDVATCLVDESHSLPRLERTDSGRLLHSLQLAQASTQRRELPVDESSWTRLKLAWDVVALYLKEQLRFGNDPPEPMIAVRVPRGDGDFRLKAIPSPEDLILQQYVLYELLRDVPNSNLLNLIPAVRYQSGLRSDSLQTTGPDNLRPVDGKTVSFAYQIDMDVLEGRTPPRREGMFRPYFDCWTDFISFIDRHVGISRQSEFHVARLDVRRFYDSLPRSAVHDALFPPLRDALEKNGAGTFTCASLFKPGVTNADARARALVDWLCDQSFGYRYLNPKTGKVDTSQPLERGVPQGPDLSAYLANISLFPLDRALSQAAQEVDGTYARYVDDMVLIAPTERDLNRLRGKIEDNLARLGLELSTKTKPLPPMRRDQVREWLTDNRGGLGVSGPFAGPPINEPLIALEPLSDAGELDRTHAITLLHDARMNDPDTSIAFILKTVTTLKRAANLRFSEFVKAASILWYRVLDDENENWVRSPREDDTPESIAEHFQRVWKKTGGKKTSFDNESVSNLLAWLDGLEGFLRRHYDRFPELSVEKQQRAIKRQREIAKHVHLGLCEHLCTLIPLEGGQSAIIQFQHMIDLKILAVHFAAGTVVLSEDPITDILPNLEDPSPAQLRFLFSLTEQQKKLGLIRQLSHTGAKPGFALRMLLHEAIVRLSIRIEGPQPQTDPLECLRQPIRDQERNLYTPETIPVLLRVLKLWLPSESENGNSDNLHVRDAALALVRIAESPADVLHKRPVLAKVLLNTGSDQKCRLLPSPAGVGILGIMSLELQDSLRQIITRLDFEQNLSCCPSTESWEQLPSFDPQRPRFQIELNYSRYLEPLVHPQRDPLINIPFWLANIFESLAKFCRRENDTDVCPPTAYNLLGPEPGTSNSDDDCWQLLGHKVPSQNLIGQAFRRDCTNHRLIAVSIKEHHDELWRIGTALADWLGLFEDSGRPASFRPPSEVREADPNYDWALETLMRVALFRLRGISLPARSLPIDEVSKLPRTITRILKCLKTFPLRTVEKENWRRVAMLLSHLAENRAFVSRYDTSHRITDLSTPGAAVALLVEISRHQFRADEKLAQELPPPSMNESEEIPKRRPVRAWCLLADRLRSLAELSGIVDEDGATLTPLIVGSRLMAITLQLRMQTLEAWVAQKDLQWEAFVNSPPDLAPWDLDGNSLLHVNQYTLRTPRIDDVSQDTQEQSSEPSNVQFLFSQLADGTATDSGNVWEALAGITSLGWCVALGSVLGVLRPPLQKVIVIPQAGFTEDDEQQFRELAQWLAVEATRFDDIPSEDQPSEDVNPVNCAVEAQESIDIPWGDLNPVFALWSAETAQAAFALLSRIDSVLGLCTTLFESPHFRIADGRKSLREVSISDGDRGIRAWQIVTASAQREAASRGAEHFEKDDDDRRWYRWTETRCGDRLLSIGTVQPGLASLAGLQDESQKSQISGKIYEKPKPTTDSNADDASHISFDPTDINILTASGADITPTVNGGSESARITKPSIQPSTGGSSVTFTAKSPADPIATDSQQSDTPATPSIQQKAAPQQSTDQMLEEFSRIQSNSWKLRPKLECHLRIALLQWNVDDSYRHPLFDACLQHQDDDDTLKDLSNARKKDNHSNWTIARASRQCDKKFPGVKSCAEHRRQALLKAALRACREFKVDALVLPEYSVRPETVKWLQKELADRGSETWVWAGTYRLPPNLDLPGSEKTQDDVNPWSSVLSLVWKPPPVNDKDSQWCIDIRKKKYPAIGMGEQFAPLTNEINPLVGSNKSLRSKILELICSEVFIVTSPSNLISAAIAYQALLRKFELSGRVKSTDELEKEVMEDIRGFGSRTSMSLDPIDRRSILFVPAMTTRTVDYAVLGQAGFLASGLTTVFCNAAKGNGNGNGQSCFIGHDGWDKVEKELFGLPGVGPYHGVLPGIYCPFRSDRGWLGIKEQALVIADIDPFYSTEGKPRPQMLHPPLQLVAHLPIIESWNYKEPTEKAKHWCRCKLVQTQVEPKFVPQLLEQIRDRSPITTVRDPEPESLAEALKSLSDAAGHKEGDWMVKRQKAYLSEHAANPQAWPPPVAVDWLWVELGDPKSVELPRIEVPPYSRSPDLPE